MAGNLDTDDSSERNGDPLVGRALAGRYDILRLLGEGGMGRVYEGRQRALDRPVAVKCIHHHLLATESMVLRFMEEARVASQLVHPNIVKIYDFGRSDPSVAPTFFLVMELLTGPDLGTVIREGGPLPVARTYAILKQVLSALGEAHARGITHRDAKPDNVILEPTVGGGERVKIIDFGIAKVHGGTGITAVGQFVGTPQYMPPEQIRGESAHVSSDLYAVGITLFQMLTGRLPFDGETVTEVLEQQLYSARPDPRRFAGPGTCPDGLAEVCLRAIHADPQERFATADAFAEQLDEAVADVLPPRSRRSPYPPPPSSPSRARVSSIPPPGSVPPTSGPKIADLSVAQRIERAADAEVAAGRMDGAIAELRRGLAIGRCWLEAGDVEMGGVALTVFGRKLGAGLRVVGRLEESERVLRNALEHTEAGESARAYVLAELATTLAERGRIGDAEACRTEALRVATALSDRDLTAKLRRLAQSFAIAVASHHAVPPEPRRSSPIPEPRHSEWRVKSVDAMAATREDADPAAVRRRR
ncbi:MAG TPA: serine/threonine-protein kinase [Polyangiaceae bacterium]|nr:serine/threonine-protein kinase [Polyangiaceae bacterium]